MINSCSFQAENARKMSGIGKNPERYCTSICDLYNLRLYKYYKMLKMS